MNILRDFIPCTKHTISVAVSMHRQRVRFLCMYKVYIFYIKKQSLDASIINNYRPISNLPFISKSIKKVVLQQLHFLASTGCYEIFQ